MGSDHDLIDRAIEFAAVKHAGQMRKGTDIPYLSHPCAVGLLLAEAGCEPDVIAAGLLHDTVEDTPTTLQELCQMFGGRVAEIVEGCTELDRNLPWETRKEQALRALASASTQVRLVQCADKLHNVRSMIRDLEQEGEALWSRFKRGRQAQAWHYWGIVRVLRSLRMHSQEAELYRQLEAAVRALFGSGES